ncbi:MAG: integrase, partial [bacterium]|nr:integrase [bacterium]
TIAVTHLDIDMETFRNSGLLESYRLSHNGQKHYFSSDGKISPWVPAQKFHAGLSKNEQLTFVAKDVRHLMKYGFDKIKASVSKNGDITFNNRIYHVAVGRENFSRHKSTKVYISAFSDKLFLFEYKQDGILLGEALCKKPFDKPAKQPPVEPNQVELITAYLEKQKMVVDRQRLITVYHRGLTRDVAQSIYTQNKQRYDSYAIKLRQPEKITGTALFNAFVLDCERQLARMPVIDYAACREK